MKYYLAIDLGASSGRHILGHYENGSLVLDEIHRFKTGMIDSPQGLVWDIDGIFKEIVFGIKKAVSLNKDIESLSIDAWGVDYVLLDKDGKEIRPFYTYRNSRLKDTYKNVHNIISFKDLYKKTGIQFASYNSIYQLYDDLKKGRLNSAYDYLTIAEYFIYKLTGVKCHEYTAESTTGLLNAKTQDYDMEIIDKLGFPRRLFKSVLKPSTFVGSLSKNIQEEVGQNINVILCPSHDTASAFAAIDCPPDSIIISSGTWSLLGVKMETPITNEDACKNNFTNEGGFNGICFLKNIMGMWIINEILKQKSIKITEALESIDSVEYHEIFDVNDVSLLSPDNMEKAVTALLKNREPKSDKELFSSVFHSLAFCYAKAISDLEEITHINYKTIYIVGGGAKNEFLNNLVSIYTKKEVKSLPIEATAIGNIKSQIIE